MEQFTLFDYLALMAIFFTWKLFEALMHPPVDKSEKTQTLTIVTSGSHLQSTVVPPPIKSSLGATLDRIFTASGDVDTDQFLEQAKQAYENIIKAFANGNIDEPVSLLDSVVAESFRASIDKRRIRGETTEVTFIGFRSTEIVTAGLVEGQAWIDVGFAADIVRVTRNDSGDIIAGDPDRIVPIAEVWTFEFNITSRSSHWVLTATGPEPCAAI